MPYKVDLHTHSEGSPDGSLSLEAYKTLLNKGGLDCAAVTDHDTIVKAVQIQKLLGKDRIIVGQEVTTSEGEIIGLYLTEAIPAGLTAQETVKRIQAQGGLVYIPHPFETVRKGLSAASLMVIADNVDIVETHNGRAIFQNKSKLALAWALKRGVACAASSDAHGIYGWGRTYSILGGMPTRENLIELLQTATYRHGYVGATGVLYPKFNRLRNRSSRA